MATLKQIAEKAGVTVSVVSRALNPRPDCHARVAPETRIRIEAAALELGFRRNREAEFLKRGQSPVIQVFLPPTANRLMADLVFGMAEAVQEEGFSLGFSFGSDREAFLHFLETAFRTRNCGVVAHQRFADPDTWSRVRPELIRGLKMVMVNACHPVPPHVPTLEIGNREGGRLAARHLLDTGCLTLGCLGCLDGREEGFAETAAAAGIRARVFDEDTLDGVCEWVRDQHGPAGMFAVTDILALKMLNGFRRMGIAIGRDVRVIGFDDLDFTPHTDPPLTTLRQPYREMGREAVRMVVNMIYGREIASRVMPPVLVVRESA